QLLTENFLLAFAGGAAGLLVAKVAIQFVLKFGPAGIPRLHETSLDLRIFAFAIGASLLAGLLFGLAPAMHFGGISLAESLKSMGPRSLSGGGGARLRNALLVVEVALALVLLVTTSLITRTFYRLITTDPGFQAEN